MRHLATCLLSGLVLAACSPATSAPAPETDAAAAAEAPAFEHADYGDMDSWLCHPSKSTGNACAVDLTTTVVNEDGSTRVEPFEAAADPGFDCFYIYPTVSFDTTWNSDLVPGLEERNVVANQFARYGAQCRLFAPMYRQRTLLELQTRLMTGTDNADLDMRWADVAGSWNHYLETENDGRPVLLVGHSQGADMIFQLLKSEIIGVPVQAQIVGAHAIGYTAHLDADGTFGGMPVCAAPGEAGCLVNFASFRATAEPPVSSGFALASETGQRAICTDPAALSGSGGALDTYMPRQSLGAPAPTDYGVPVETPFVKLPGLLSAECRSNETHDWLAVTVNAGDGPRADNIPGDVVVNGQTLEDWGLHLIDMNIAMGNLVEIAAAQAASLEDAQ